MIIMKKSKKNQFDQKKSSFQECRTETLKTGFIYFESKTSPRDSPVLFFFLLRENEKNAKGS